MKIHLYIFLLEAFLLISTCRGDEKVVGDKDELVLIEADEQQKPKRQAEEGRAIAAGGITQHIFGSAPGHFVLRTVPKDAALESDTDYLSILRQIESGSLQPAAAQARPTVQQYLIQRQPQSNFAPNAAALGTEQKYIQLQPSQLKQRPHSSFPQNLQPTYQPSRLPLVIRPQSARPVQTVHSNQQLFPSSPGHSLHEARVQAALSVGEDKSALGQSANQAVFQFGTKPQSAIGESTFEKELAQLVAANQASELKAKLQVQPQQIQYIQPQKQSVAVPSKPKYSFLRPEPQTSKYVAPVARTKGPKFPQQYLIETTKPQPVAARPVIKAKPQPQYYQFPAEEQKVYDYQSFQEAPSAVKIVPPPQLQHQSPQYKLASKETNEQAAPAYLQYYQAIKPDEGSSVNDVKLESYINKYATQKSQPSASPSIAEEISYVPKYQTQTKSEETGEFINYKPSKQLSQFSADDDALIQSIISQTLQKSKQQTLGGFASSKTIGAESQPSSVSPSHSSIFVSKALIPKKNPSHSVTIEQADESEEEIRTVRLPPPKNNKVYTQEEFQALVAAGYSVTPVPVTDDEDNKPHFSPAPENYPGHSKYQGSTVAPETSQTYQKQSSESYVTATQAPRVRKVQRRRPVNSSRYRLQPEDTQIESESQSQASYALPAERERVNYGMRKHVRTRTQHRQEDALEEESE